MATLASLLFSGSSSFLQVTRITNISRMSSNLGQIRPLTAELAALECLKNQLCPVTVLVLVDSQVSARCPWATFFFFFFCDQFRVPFKVISAHMRRANQ